MEEDNNGVGYVVSCEHHTLHPHIYCRIVIAGELLAHNFKLVSQAKGVSKV